MSASKRPIRRPCMCRASARLAATVDLPTPPLPLATATTCLTPGRLIFGGPPVGGGMLYLLRGLICYRVADFGDRHASHWHSSRSVSRVYRPVSCPSFQVTL